MHRLIQQEDNEIFSPTTQIILVVVAILSSIISLFFPIVYFVKRKCREHPSSLIAIISILQALSNYNVILIAVNIYKFQHFVKINQIFEFLVFNRTSQPTETQFCQINFTIYILLELMSIAFNICFSADLLITLKKPFFAGSKRLKFYNIFCLFFVACSLPMSIVQAQGTLLHIYICNKQFHSRSIYKIPFAFLISVGLFYLFSFIIIILSFKTVQTSSIRKKYIRFHRIILFTLILLWACPIATNILILMEDQSSTIFHVFNLASFVSLLISGAIINIVRFYMDPYVWTQVKKLFTQRTGNKKKQIKNEDEDQSKHQDEVVETWNLPLAHAVATFHHQSVISYIIEIVLQTCTNTPEQQAIQRSQYNHMHHDKKYHAESTILSLKQIKKMLRSGTKEDTKRLTKITKSIQMLCLAKQKKQKNIMKTQDFLNEKGIISNSNTDDQQMLKTIANVIKQDKAITIKVKSYADPVFLALRLLDNITSDELNKTLSLALNADNIKKARESLGASGSFFFFSYDNRLVIKTINQSECDIFLKILPQYYEHILKNPSSLISRAYGLFSVQIAGISKIYFIMMENTLKIFEENHVVYKKYDLKGSTIKRQVRNPNADVFKDINLLKSDDAFLIMPQARRTQLLTQIQADISLLCSQNIMDYSLLLGIGSYKKIRRDNNPILHELDLSPQQQQNEWRCFDDGYQITGKIYSLSLIDYLQEFDFNKYMELKLKKVFKGGGDISSIDAYSYYNRFMAFVSRIIVVFKG